MGKKKRKRKKKKTTSGEKQPVSANDVRKMQLNSEYQLKNWLKRTGFCSGALRKELGIYLETDTLHNNLTIGKGRKKITITIMQAKMLSEMLSHQIRSLSDK